MLLTAVLLVVGLSDECDVLCVTAKNVNEPFCLARAG